MRSFKIQDSSVGYISNTTSYFKGKSPSAVAKKFGSKLFRLYPNNTINIIIKETTRGSNNSLYCYNIEKIVFKEPISRTLPNGTTITNTFKTNVISCDIDNEYLFSERINLKTMEKKLI